MCLADYCDVLQCDAYAAAVAAVARDAPPPPQVARCAAGAMERAQHRCQARPACAKAHSVAALTHGHAAMLFLFAAIAQVIVDTCFPLDAADARVHELNGA